MKIALVMLTLMVVAGCKPPAKPKEYVLATELRVRAEPSQKGAALDLLKFGAEVEVLTVSTETETINGITSPWKQIRYGEKTGWVFGGFLGSESWYTIAKICVENGNLWQNNGCRNPVAHALFQRILLTGGTSSHSCPNEYSRYYFYPDSRCKNVSVSVGTDTYSGNYSFDSENSITCHVSGMRLNQMTGEEVEYSTSVSIEVLDASSAKITYHNGDGSSDERRLDISGFQESPAYSEFSACFSEN